MKKIRKVLGESLTPAARAWVRYSPVPVGKAWLWKRFWWRYHEFSSRTRFGMRVTGNTRDLIQRYLYYFGTWEPNITHWISSTLKVGDCFIDVGANIGYYSLLASSIVGPTGKVVAIEAAPWIHSILDKHVRLNRLQNIRTVLAAAAATKGVVRLFPGGADNIGSTTMIPRGDLSIEVESLPMHEILKEDEVERARIIKIDVEGAELQVIHGLDPLFRSLRPDVEILMEISPALMPDGERSTSAIFSIMKENGFSAYVLENDYSAESYLAAGGGQCPVALANAGINLQADILFSRLQY